MPSQEEKVVKIIHSEKIVRPNRLVNPKDIYDKCLKRQVKILGKEEIIEIDKGQWESSVNGDAQIFSEVAGSVIAPVDLVGMFDSYEGVNVENDIDCASVLTGTETSVNEPLVKLVKGKFTLNVYSGCNNGEVVAVSDLGSKGNLTNDERREYQDHVYNITHSFLGRSNSETVEDMGWDEDLPLLSIVDDCAATVVTISSTLELINKQVELGKFSGVRIDLAVATAQGIAMLMAEADRLGIPVELNVGFVQWGLTEGVGPNKEHQNYIANVNSIDDLKKGDLSVGDMGDAACIAEGSVINGQRVDGYFSRDDARNIVWTEGEGKDLTLFFAKGGLMMYAARKEASQGLEREETVVMAQASRKTINGEFLAVFSDLLEPVEQWRRQHAA